MIYEDSARVSASDAEAVAEDVLQNAESMDRYPENVVESANRILDCLDADGTADGIDTDWLANSVYGYGFGYTKEQSLYAMLSNIQSVDSQTDVQFVEHIGEATVGMTGWEVEQFVSGQIVRFEADQLESARAAAAEAYAAVEMAIDDPVAVEQIDDE